MKIASAEIHRQTKNCPSDLTKDTQRNHKYPMYFIRSEPMGTTDIKNILIKTPIL